MKTSKTISKKTYESYTFDAYIQQEIRDLSRLDNWHGCLALLEDYFFIILSIVLTCQVSFYFYPLAVMIIGARQRALATLLHEAAHGVLAKNKRLNFALGFFFSGCLIFQTFTAYKNSHVHLHHGHFGDASLDPDYQFHIQEGLYNVTKPREFVIHIILTFLFWKVPSYLYSLIKCRLLKGPSRLESVVLLLYLLTIVLLPIVLNFCKIFILFWIIPYLTTFQIIGWFIELSEHYPLMEIKSINVYMSRNRKSHWLESFFTSIHNENYHLAHHLNPSTPFWNLPKAHKIRLRDPIYANIDKYAGGIFISSNSSDSIIRSILEQIQQLSQQQN
jgi:fatty acid desaturase